MKKTTAKRRPKAKHPMQPVILAKDGVHRYKANAIVQWMLDQGRDGKAFDLNEIARTSFPREDREQLAQLIGYSVSGACGLSYMSDAVCEKAMRESRRLLPKKDRKK